MTAKNGLVPYLRLSNKMKPMKSVEKIDNYIKCFNDIINNIAYKYILIFCILVSCFISIYYSGISLWADELFSVAKTSSSISLLSVIKEASLFDSWPPLYYIFLHCNQILFGNSELSLRLISIISNVLCIPILYLFAKEIYSKKEALLACVLFSFSPFALSYSVEVRGYSLFLLLTTLSFYLFINFYKNKNNNFSLYSYLIVALLCTLTHYFGLMIVIFQLLFLFMNSKNILKQNYIIFLIFICIILIYPLIHFDKLYFKSQIFEYNSIFSSNIFNRDFFILKELIPNLIFNIYPVTEKILVYICFFYFICKFKEQSNQIILFFILLPIVSINLFAYKFMAFLHVRYFIFVLPLIYIMTAHVMNKILQKYYYIILLCILIFLSCNIGKIEISKTSVQDRNNVIFLKENLIKDNNTIILHSKLYYIEYYLKKYNINNYAMTFFDLSENEKEIEYLLDNNKTIYVLYPFDIQQKDINNFSNKFKIIKVYNRIYKIEKTNINI